MTDKAKAVWTARRAVVEEFGVPLDLAARACGGSQKSYRDRALLDNWKVRSAGEGRSRADRIAKISDKLLARVERLDFLTADADPTEKDISELSGAIKLLAKIADTSQDDDGERERRMVRDADIAATLERLDGKIIELARHFAEALAQEGVLDTAPGAGEP